MKELSARRCTAKVRWVSGGGFKEDFLEEVLLNLHLQRFSERQRGRTERDEGHLRQRMYVDNVRGAPGE